MKHLIFQIKESVGSK